MKNPGFILFIVLLVLKLVGVITWSWWWITAPLWLGFVLLFLAVGGIAAIASWLD
jgi:hypothetical protein